MEGGSEEVVRGCEVCTQRRYRTRETRKYVETGVVETPGGREIDQRLLGAGAVVWFGRSGQAGKYAVSINKQIN